MSPSAEASASTNSGSRSAPPEGAWSKRFRYGFDKSIKVSDYLSTYANAVSHKVGGERFWPSSNDMPLEIEKCERILRAFTVEGIPQKEVKEEKVLDGKGNWVTKKRKVLRKIPPAAIKKCKGIAIYSSMRSGIAPLGGGGGAGIVLARLPDGSWSAPSAITPQSMSAGLLLGVDFLDVILLINSDKALESFMSHKVTLGAETGVTAGPFGAGTSAESGIERAPIYSYVRARGAFAGVEIMGQAFLHRFDENERFYYWPGVTARDILTGHVRMPPLIAPVHRALRDAELGKAQGGKLETVLYDVVKMPESEVMKMLGPGRVSSPKRFVAGGSGTTSAGTSTPQLKAEGEDKGEKEGDLEEVLKEEGDPQPMAAEEEDDDDDLVKEGEKLKLPPTPEELQLLEQAGIPDEEDLRFEQEERRKAYQLPPPPMHTQVQKYWRAHPNKAVLRPTKQLVMDGPHSEDVRIAQYVKLPSSPRSSLEIREEEETKVKDLADQLQTASIMDRDEKDESVLLSGVSEEEADKVMQMAKDSEDMLEMKEEGLMDQRYKKSDSGRRDSADELAAMANELHLSGEKDKATTDKIDKGKQLPNRDSNALPLPVQETEDHAGEKKLEEQPKPNGDTMSRNSTSSPAPSEQLPDGPALEASSDSPRMSLDENGVAKSPPSRPPRKRPARQQKA